MKTVIKVALSLSLFSILSGQGSAKAQTIVQSIRQSSSLFQQLTSTRECQDCNLSNFDFSGLDLSGVNLENANLSNANFSNANLQGANLTGANLYLADLSQSNLSQTTLDQAKLGSADLTGALLTNSSLSNSSATYADFTQANLSGASIQNSNLSDSNFTGANFSEASISNSRLNYANLEQANLATASLTNTSLTTASLEGALLPEGTSSPLQPSASVAQNIEDEAQVPVENPPIDQATEEQIEPDSENANQAVESQTEFIGTPLTTQAFQQPSAETLPPGTVVGRVGARLYQLPDNVAGDDDTAFYPTFQFSAGIAKDLEISASYQQADSNSPGTQGIFSVNRGGDDPGNDEATISAKYRFWKSSDENIQASIIGALSFGNRQATFFPPAGASIRLENDGVVPLVQLPVTAKLGKRTRATISPTVAFFADSNALFLFAPPVANPGEFGTTFGLTVAASHELLPRVALFGDAFAPLTGNNSVNLDTGLPNREIAFNAGVRFLVNPRVGLDLFATNSQGTLGPLALTTQSDDIGVGANLVFLPNLFAGNRKIADNFGDNPNSPDSPLTDDGIGFFDGGTLPKNKLGLHFQGGGQGIKTALRYGILKDLEGSIFLDYTFGDVDESEQGIGAKIRVLNQDKGAPFTASIQGTLSQSNEPFLNFLNDDSSAFANSGVNETLPSILNRDGTNGGGRLFIVTLSVPLHYKINNNASVWLTPAVGVVQREGVEAGGFNVGGSVQVVKDVDFIAEVGADLIGRGNGFNDAGTLEDQIPWTVAIRWDPSKVLGLKNQNALAKPNFELFVTNRVGSSVWQQLRVREGGDPAVGVGVFLPF